MEESNFPDDKLMRLVSDNQCSNPQLCFEYIISSLEQGRLRWDILLYLSISFASRFSRNFLKPLCTAS